MKNIILAVSFIFYAAVLTAQGPSQVDVKWFEEPSHPKIEALNDHAFLSGDENTFYYLHRTDMAYAYIIKYNSQTHVMQELQINNIKTDGVEREWRNVQSIGGVIHIFTSFKNKKHKKYYYFVETVDMEKFELRNNPRMIAEVDYSNHKKVDYSSLLVTLSPDGQKVFIGTTLNNKDGEVLWYRFQVADQSINKLWETEGANTDRGLFIKKYLIDNKANAYLVFYGNEDRFVRYFGKDGAPAIDQSIQLDAPDKSIASAQFFIDQKERLVCAGLYAQGKSPSAIGAFSIMMSEGLKDKPYTYTKAFDKAFLSKGMDQRSAEKMEENLEKGKDFDRGYIYTFGEPVQRADGGFSLIAQKYNLIVKVSRSQSGTTTTYTYYYDDIMVMTYNQQGEIVWTQKIPQYQKLVDRQKFFGSYVVGLGANNQMNFIFNLPATSILKRGSTIEKTVCISLDAQGKESFMELDMQGERGEKFSPAISTYLGNNKFLIGSNEAKLFTYPKTYWGTLILK